jgi:hypothetical protein
MAMRTIKTPDGREWMVWLAMCRVSPMEAGGSC